MWKIIKKSTGLGYWLAYEFDYTINQIVSPIPKNTYSIFHYKITRQKWSTMSPDTIKWHSITGRPKYLKISHKIKKFKTQNVHGLGREALSYVIKQESNVPRKRPRTRNWDLNIQKCKGNWGKGYNSMLKPEKKDNSSDHLPCAY